VLDEKNGLGKESTFEFKYAPSHTRTTKLGKSNGLSKPLLNFGVEVIGLMGLAVPVFMAAALSYILYPFVRVAMAA
jgi:hypothetical protein